MVWRGRGSLKSAAARVLVVAALVACLAGSTGDARSSPVASSGKRPKIALDAGAIAQAKRIVVQLQDLPFRPRAAWFPNTQWKAGKVNKTGPLLSWCGRVADLSSITFRGGWSSRFDQFGDSRLWELTSAAAVLATPSQARFFFDTGDALTARCLKKGTTIGADRFTSVRRVRPHSLADQQVEFRLRKASTRVPGRKLGTVIVYLRRGSIVIELTFDWGKTPIPTSLIDTIVKKIAARAN